MMKNVLKQNRNTLIQKLFINFINFVFLDSKRKNTYKKLEKVK